MSTFIKLLFPCLLLSSCFLNADKKAAPKAWTDYEKAKAEKPLIKWQGEYTGEEKGKKIGWQITVLKTDNFLTAKYQGGLPGAGWDRTKITSKVMSLKEVKKLTETLKKVERKSPTLGLKAPENATVKFPEGFTNIKDGLLQAGGKTKKEVGSFKMHIEFKLPFKPGRNPGNQDRGNSGIYIYNNYEIQVIDSFALDFNAKNNAIKTESLPEQWCGCFYKMKKADLNMTFPPLSWQTYDIDFTAPVFKDGKKVKNARITVRHNGVIIHDDFELKTGTGAGAKRKQLARGHIFFQDHGNPVVYRNVWVVEK